MLEVGRVNYWPGALFKDALTSELGAMGMMFIAGLLEGFVAPSDFSFYPRFSIFVFFFALWGLVFLKWGRLR